MAFLDVVTSVTKTAGGPTPSSEAFLVASLAFLASKYPYGTCSGPTIPTTSKRSASQQLWVAWMKIAFLRLKEGSVSLVKPLAVSVISLTKAVDLSSSADGYAIGSLSMG